MKWSTYNQSLVRRGEIRIGFDVIDNWDRELKQMNKNKVGEQPFQYPNTFLLLIGICQSIFPFALQTNRRNCTRTCQMESSINPSLH